MKKEVEGLQRLRADIDSVDKNIIEALAARMDLVREIGRYKRARGVETLDKRRFQELIRDRCMQARTYSLPEKLVRDIFTRIHDEAVALQEREKDV